MRPSIRKLIPALVIPLLVGLAGCGGPGGAGSGEGGTPLTFVLPAGSVMQFHPWYLAERLGFFKDEGVQVKLVAGDGSSSIIQQIIAGNADAGVPSPAAILVAADSGRELTGIFQYFQSNVFTLAAPTSGGLTSVDQLRGKAVGVSDLAGGEVPLVRAALREAGLKDGTDVKITPVGEGGALTLEALRKDRVQAYASSLFDVALVGATGAPMTNILPENLRSFPANTVITTPDTLKAKRAALTKMMRAVAKAMVWTKANPDAAKALSAKEAPEEFDNPAVADSGWKAAETLKELPQQIQGQPLGTFVPQNWEQYQQFLLQGTREEGALSRPVDLKKLLDSSLLADINKFDQAAVIQQAKAYKVTS
ncbi:ABC transporter substrate-binding protein [Sphaerisporangium perillae]|uniref:ABC transporter substrate-binding protein n=1 Tax=Sphaerisporangium perillae TaxID=2935860 RepID=UPI00200DCB23|nr:ABC transporter substrate-binding protein [Sphaerisporangium perillae]